MVLELKWYFSKKFKSPKTWNLNGVWNLNGDHPGNWNLNGSDFR